MVNLWFLSFVATGFLLIGNIAKSSCDGLGDANPKALIAQSLEDLRSGRATDSAHYDVFDNPVSRTNLSSLSATLEAVRTLDDAAIASIGASISHIVGTKLTLIYGGSRRLARDGVLEAGEASRVDAVVKSLNDEIRTIRLSQDNRELVENYLTFDRKLTFLTRFMRPPKEGQSERRSYYIGLLERFEAYIKPS